ncbi:MAG: hypothetical protein JKY61_12800 [Planctomycetes bacterium]|nr:hypothetical protein [Planctomycetota bacterium]
MMLVTPSGKRVQAFQWDSSASSGYLFEALEAREISYTPVAYSLRLGPSSSFETVKKGDWIILDGSEAYKVQGGAFDLILRVKLDYDPESPDIVEAEHEGNHYIIDTENKVIDVYSSDGVRMPKSVLPVFQIIADNELPSFDSLRVEFEDGVIARNENDKADHAQELRRAV